MQISVQLEFGSTRPEVLFLVFFISQATIYGMYEENKKSDSGQSNRSGWAGIGATHKRLDCIGGLRNGVAGFGASPIFEPVVAIRLQRLR